MMQLFFKNSRRLTTITSGELLIEQAKNWVVISLNRKNALNALTTDMVSSIKNTLLECHETKDVAGIIIRSSDMSEQSRAFCAGGDVKSLCLEKGSPQDNRKRFFQEEYCMNYLTSVVCKPVISLVNKLCIGGGIGLSTHGMYSICSSDCSFSMPECSIGFFPDVGSGNFLAKMPHNIGIMLGLSGLPITAQEALALNIVSHVCPDSVGLGRLYEDIVGCATNVDAYEYMKAYTLEQVRNEKKLTHFRNVRVEKLERIFGQRTIAEILRLLNEEIEADRENAAFLQGLFDSISGGSPTSLIVTLKYLRAAKKMNLRQCLQSEYSIARRFMVDEESDFYKGVHSKLVARQKTDMRGLWKSGPTDEYIDSFFDRPKDADDRLTLPEIEHFKKFD